MNTKYVKRYRRAPGLELAQLASASTLFPYPLVYESYGSPTCETHAPSNTALIHESINLLEPEFYILILAHPVGKMRIIQEPNKVAL